jgi:phosphate transport system substrate-binding protein
MTSNFNYVKCPKCEHDRNPATATKCEICGTSLRKQGSPMPLVAAGLITLALLGAGAYFLKDKLSGVAPQAVASPDTTTVAPDQATPAAAPSAVAVAPNNAPPVQGAVVATYSSLAEVPNVPQGVFNYGGSTTFAPLRSPTIVSAISQASPQFQVRYTEPTTGKPGSGKGIAMLLGGQLSFAQSSRALKDEEYAQAKNRGFALEAVPVAIDGIALYVSPKLLKQGVKGLTLAQVRDIFTGKIRNWRAVGGPNLAITPFSRNLQAGGTVDFFYENVMEKQPLGASVKEIRDTTESIRRVATTAGGIGYATAAEVINQQMIRLLPIAKEAGTQSFVSPCVDPTCTAINEKAFADGAYPITRRLFVILKRDGRLDEQAGVAYTNMLLSDEGQKLSEQAGFVPIR